ncbi:hypothetical protein L7F22_005710 [Adiantum nelumboides]|nr:hypothetical protein [Adiantum nelumboides]
MQQGKVQPRLRRRLCHPGECCGDWLLKPLSSADHELVIKAPVHRAQCPSQTDASAGPKPSRRDAPSFAGPRCLAASPAAASATSCCPAAFIDAPTSAMKATARPARESSGPNAIAASTKRTCAVAMAWPRRAARVQT